MSAQLQIDKISSHLVSETDTLFNSNTAEVMPDKRDDMAL